MKNYILFGFITFSFLLSSCNSENAKQSQLNNYTSQFDDKAKLYLLIDVYGCKACIDDIPILIKRETEQVKGNIQVIISSRSLKMALAYADKFNTIAVAIDENNELPNYIQPGSIGIIYSKDCNKLIELDIENYKTEIEKLHLFCE